LAFSAQPKAMEISLNSLGSSQTCLSRTWETVFQSGHHLRRISPQTATFRRTQPFIGQPSNHQASVVSSSLMFRSASHETCFLVIHFHGLKIVLGSTWYRWMCLNCYTYVRYQVWLLCTDDTGGVVLKLKKKKKILKEGILAICWLLILVIDPSFVIRYCFKLMSILTCNWHIFLAHMTLFQTQAHFNSLLAFIFSL
jgi:hypothetical protein